MGSENTALTKSLPWSKSYSSKEETNTCLLLIIIIVVVITCNTFVVFWAKCCFYLSIYPLLSVQFSSVAHPCQTLCDPMDCSTPALPVHHQLSEVTQTHVHWVGDAIQPSHPLPSPSPPAFNLSQHQGVFKWVSSSHQVAEVLKFQFQHQSFQWIFRTHCL